MTGSEAKDAELSARATRRAVARLRKGAALALVLTAASLVAGALVWSFGRTSTHWSGLAPWPTQRLSPSPTYVTGPRNFEPGERCAGAGPRSGIALHGSANAAAGASNSATPIPANKTPPFVIGGAYPSRCSLKRGCGRISVDDHALHAFDVHPATPGRLT